MALIVVLATVAVAASQGTVEIDLKTLLTEKGEMFLLAPGETERIDGGRITVELLEIGYDPAFISDVRVDDIVFSSDNPQQGESVHITVLVTNAGSGTAHASVTVTYGDEQDGSSTGGVSIVELDPGQTEILEFDHTYTEERIYTVMVVAQANNDINTGNNVRCEEIRVGNPEGPGSAGCGALPQQVLPKQAHVLYTRYQGQNVVDQQGLWLSSDDIGFVVEIIKLSGSKAVLSVPR